MTKRPLFTRRSAIPAATLAGILIVLGAVGWWAHSLRVAAKVTPGGEGVAAIPGVVTVQLHQGQLSYACAPGVVDPAELSAEEGLLEMWSATDLEVYPLTGGGLGIHVETSALGSGSMDAIGFAGNKSGDLASFVPASCMLPASELVLAAGSTVTGESTVLILSNPSATAVSAKVHVLSPLGSLDDAADTGQDVLVPAESTVTVLPAVWVPGEGRLGLFIESDGLGVAAWLQSSGLDGEVPVGLGRLTGQVPSDQVLLLGVSPDAHDIVRIANPNTSPVNTAISVLATDGTSPLPGADDVQVEGRTVFDVEVGDLPDDAMALLVTSDAPVGASVTEAYEGDAFAKNSALNVGVRTLVGAANPVEEVRLPSVLEIKRLSNAVGAELLEADLILANTSSRSSTVRIGDRSVWVEAGAVFSVDLSEDEDIVDLEVEDSGSVFAVVLLEAKTDSGLTRSVVTLPQDEASRNRQQIVLRPYR